MGLVTPFLENVEIIVSTVAMVAEIELLTNFSTTNMMLDSIKPSIEDFLMVSSPKFLPYQVWKSRITLVLRVDSIVTENAPAVNNFLGSSD